MLRRIFIGVYMVNRYKTETQAMNEKEERNTRSSCLNRAQSEATRKCHLPLALRQECQLCQSASRESSEEQSICPYGQGNRICGRAGLCILVWGMERRTWTRVLVWGMERRTWTRVTIKNQHGCLPLASVFQCSSAGGLGQH